MDKRILRSAIKKLAMFLSTEKGQACICRVIDEMQEGRKSEVQVSAKTNPASSSYADQISASERSSLLWGG